MAHGLGDTVAGLFQLATHMRVSHPIFGMQARGVNGRDEPHDRIEDMAEFHLHAITQLQPRGPYFLIGYSLGGLVTLEIARRLSDRGEKIALLAMLDSYPHQRHLSVGQRVRLASRVARQRAASLLRQGDLGRSGVNKNESKNVLEQPTFEPPARMREYQSRALRNYHPRFYGGKVRFLRPAIPTQFPDDPVAVWAQLVKQMEVESVPCDHFGMLTTHVGEVASILMEAVRSFPTEISGGAQDH